MTLVEAPSDAAQAETSQTDAAAATGEQPGADTSTLPASAAEQQQLANIAHTGDGTTTVEPAVADAVPVEKGTAIAGVSAGRPDPQYIVPSYLRPVA